MARVLALEPYYGGSHRAFLDGWALHSRHEITLLTLKPHHWKWRMRHAAITLAEQLRSAPTVADFDLVWCSSMMNLPEFLGTAPRQLRLLPSVAYFHENQLLYPSQHADDRDVHFAFTHWATIAAATEVWFNSRFNQASLFDGLAALLKRMPDHRDAFDRERLESISWVLSPGIEEAAFAPRNPRDDGPVRLCWAARFEHDKGPNLLLGALRRLRDRTSQFRLTVMGEQFTETPPSLARLKEEFAPHLDHFGFEKDRWRYLQRLAGSDVFISTAQHEFFGLSVMEAAAAGCTLAIPRHLSYPELFPDDGTGPCFYDNTPEDLAEVLHTLVTLPAHQRPTHRDVAREYVWSRRASALDDAVARCIDRHGSPRFVETPT